ncbi:MAG TPA: glucose-6-phosphate dehydrogenase, partial [Terriglobales bacterium]|nr:glucose-6-phosphate dehydrogenase [Terriglobales bacterium]
MIGAFIIFGASGDLTSRYLIPALARLREADELPDSMKILGIASSPWDTRTFRERMSKNLEKNCSQLSSKSRASLVSQLEYQQADVTDSRQVAKSLKPLNDPVIVHLALPPPVFGPAIEALKNCGLPEGSRIVIEKPFGESVASAQNLNQLLHERFPEGSVFRIDHFLGKQTVQNLLGLRFANRFFEPLWNSQHIAKVEIRWDETVTAEGRAGYYDQAGALRDMCQNHLLQLLCLAGMEAVPCLD